MVQLETPERTGLLDGDLLEQLDHGMTVSVFASKLARRLGCSEAFVQDIALAGLLHDIGKIRLSRYVEEGTSMAVDEIKYSRMHSMFSYEILKKRGFSENVLQMVLYHHEKYDGSGYPKNLRGEEIPLGARILHICDVYAARISERPYRSAFDSHTAFLLMIEEAKNYDMKIFLAFQRMLHEETMNCCNLLNDLPVNEKQELLCELLFPAASAKE